MVGISKTMLFDILISPFRTPTGPKALKPAQNGVFWNKKAGARSPKLRTFARAPLRGALAYVENLRGSEWRRQAQICLWGERL